MKKSNLLISTFTLFLVFFMQYCDGTSINNNEIDENYPAKLFPLTEDEWQKLQNEFDLLNDSTICTKLNEYGFTGDRDNSKIHPDQGIKIDESTALRIAADCVLKNKKFTNVSDSLDLIASLSFSTVLEEDSTKWKFTFGPQTYNGYEIPFSWIEVYLYGDGVYRLSGFWYSDIYIPDDDNIDIENAKEKIIGESITWYGDDGKPNEFIIDQESILEPIVKAIFPLDKEDCIELRVVWKIPIEFGSFTGWHVYLDTSTGEIIAIIQEFRT